MSWQKTSPLSSAIWRRAPEVVGSWSIHAKLLRRSRLPRTVAGPGFSTSLFTVMSMSFAQQSGSS
jgi:hypothetical protein